MHPWMVILIGLVAALAFLHGCLAVHHGKALMAARGADRQRHAAAAMFALSGAFTLCFALGVLVLTATPIAR